MLYDALENERKRLEKSILKRIKRLKKSLLAKQAELDECRRQEEYEQKGNLLTCHFPKLKKGMREIVVEDFFNDNQEVVIALDEKKSPQQNIAFYFAKVKKLIRRMEILPEVMLAMEKEIGDWLTLLHTIEKATRMEELRDIKESAHLLESAKEKKESVKKVAFHTFFSESEHKILVGRDAESNDLLTFQKAAGDDIWLHAHGCPGSHVVIRVQPGRDVDRKTLVDAMQLALYFSKRRSGIHQKHEVLWCKRRDVQKRRGAPKGEVMVAGGTIERVELDPEHVARIKMRNK
jgi:predicted ribosome quality control (RQC) complex YloA/Tae2 family protein